MSQLHVLCMGGTFHACYNGISGLRFLSESSGEVHFECDISPFRIQTLIPSHPCVCMITSTLVSDPLWKAVDTEIKASSVENTELKRFSL